MAKTEKWLCTGCNFLLGYVEDKALLRIKRKDLYVQVEGGSVMMNCCRCGKVNFLADNKSEQPATTELRESNEEGGQG